MRTEKKPTSVRLPQESKFVKLFKKLFMRGRGQKGVGRGREEVGRGREG